MIFNKVINRKIVNKVVDKKIVNKKSLNLAKVLKRKINTLYIRL